MVGRHVHCSFACQEPGGFFVRGDVNVKLRSDWNAAAFEHAKASATLQKVKVMGI